MKSKKTVWYYVKKDVMKLFKYGLYPRSLLDNIDYLIKQSEDLEEINKLLALKDVVIDLKVNTK